MKYFMIALMLVCSFARAESVVRYKYFSNQPELGDTVGWGSAFAISEHTLLTAAHNVVNEQTGKIYSKMFVEIDGQWIPCSVCKTPKFDRDCLDLAVIEVPKIIVLKPLLFGDDVSINSKVIVRAGRLDGPVENLKGKVTQKWVEAGLKHLIEVEFDHGQSGGAVLADGKVVGIILAGVSTGIQIAGKDLRHDMGFFLPVCIIKDFLKK